MLTAAQPHFQPKHHNIPQLGRIYPIFSSKKHLPCTDSPPPKLTTFHLLIHLRDKLSFLLNTLPSRNMTSIPADASRFFSPEVVMSTIAFLKTRRNSPPRLIFPLSPR